MTEPTRDHYQDIRLFTTKGSWIKLALLLVVLISLPLILPGYRIFTFNYMAVFVIVGLGMNVLVGDTGQVSLGHAGFLAIGASVETGGAIPCNCYSGFRLSSDTNHCSLGLVWGTHGAGGARYYARPVPIIGGRQQVLCDRRYHISVSTWCAKSFRHSCWTGVPGHQGQ